MNKKRKTISRFLATILTATLMTTGLFIAPATTAYAAPAQSLASQISAIGGLVATISPGDPGVITVLGSANVSSTINLNIDSNVTINWGADLSGSTASGKYLLNLSGGGTFNVVGGATIQNGSGIMTITGAGTSANLDDGLLLTPASGNGTSINIAASGAVLTVNSGGAIDNSGSNSAVNVTAGVTGVKININGGKVASSPSGYAINDGGTALCSNDTKITVTGGEVTAGSACAIKSTGATSELIVLGGIIENSATINSNPCVYMNGGTGDNVIVSGGVVRASDNNLGYGIQTTGNVTVSGDAKIEATSGRAVNLVGMDSIITVNGGSITATTGTAICTATTNPSTVQNTKIIINGGTVSTTEDAAHGNARAIYATGADSEVIINGGVVSVASDEAEAIYTSGQNSRVTVNGGQVWATGHFAIEAYSGGYVYINGGFVFAYGTKSLSDRVGASIKSSAIGATGLDRIIVSGEGVVAVWDRGAWGAAPWNQDDYTEGYANHLDTYPAGLVFDSDPPTIPPGATPANNVYWQNSGFASGIHYSNGDNSGFFALDEVFVVKVSHFVTVIGGLGTGAYDVGSPVYVEANPAPAGMEFDFWDIVFGTVYLYGPSGTFTMPDADVTIEALYKDKKYDLSVVGGSGSGSYKQGEIVQITAGAAPEGQEFDFWEISGGALSDPFSAFALYYMPAQDAQATAKYKDIPYYEFSLVGGSVVSSSVPPIGAKYPAGTIIVINAPSAFPAGYSFSGW
ncbi:MAG: hypothetical protein FWH48_06005, partial [Oscillospiraceae bacterium]|nr:hypothetical protein [Oscillospiraceae bacterium]